MSRVGLKRNPAQVRPLRPVHKASTTRRDFLKRVGLGASAVGGSILFGGCATGPAGSGRVEIAPRTVSERVAHEQLFMLIDSATGLHEMTGVGANKQPVVDPAIPSFYSNVMAGQPKTIARKKAVQLMIEPTAEDWLRFLLPDKTWNAFAKPFEQLFADKGKLGEFNRYLENVTGEMGTIGVRDISATLGPGLGTSLARDALAPVLDFVVEWWQGVRMKPFLADTSGSNFYFYLLDVMEKNPALQRGPINAGTIKHLRRAIHSNLISFNHARVTMEDGFRWYDINPDKAVTNPKLRSEMDKNPALTEFRDALHYFCGIAANAQAILHHRAQFFMNEYDQQF